VEKNLRKPEKIKMNKITLFSSCFFFSKNGPMTQEFIFRLFGELKEYTGVHTPEFPKMVDLLEVLIKILPFFF
jgi:hypothetical protein